MADRLRRAITAVQNADFIVGNTRKVPGEFLELNLIDYDEQKRGILIALREITSDDYLPPDQVCGEPIAKGESIYQFKWISAHFGARRMYMHFCLKGRQGQERFVLFGLHVDHSRKL